MDEPTRMPEGRLRLVLIQGIAVRLSKAKYSSVKETDVIPA